MNRREIVKGENVTGPWETTQAPGALAGIKVVDLTINILGPVCTQVLGDMGADVIKVEPPEGDQNRHIGPQRHPFMSALYLTVNRNKRAVVLNLKKPEAHAALMKLVEEADVFVHSMRPAAAKRLGIDYEAVRARNPRIVFGFAPGYRPDGPWRDRPAYDDVIQGESGVAAMCEQAFGEARYFPAAIADKFCGHTLAHAVTLALFARERTGKGQEVVVPMFENMLAFNMLDHQWGGVFDPPDGGIGYNRLMTPFRRPYATSDGFMCIMASNDDQWQRLLVAVGRPDCAEDPRFIKLVDRARNIEALYQIMMEQLRTRSTDEWDQRLTEADIPHGRLRRLRDLESDPYLEETGFFTRYDHPSEGRLVNAASPIQFSQTPTSWRRPPPGLGEHSQEVFATLGYGTDEIAAMGKK